jgi:hypothetical protein
MARLQFRPRRERPIRPGRNHVEVKRHFPAPRSIPAWVVKFLVFEI